MSASHEKPENYLGLAEKVWDESEKRKNRYSKCKGTVIKYKKVLHLEE